MMFLHGSVYTRLQEHLDELVGDVVVLKVHDGPPGIGGTDNLLDGDGRPQHFDYRVGGTVTWTFGDLFYKPPLFRWPWSRREPPSPYTYIYAVTCWTILGVPVMRVDWDKPTPIVLGPGGQLILTEIGRPKIGKRVCRDVTTSKER